MKLDHHEFVRQATEAYNECTGGKWIGADKWDLKELEAFAASAMEFARNGEWEDALRWAKRCVEMEKRIGFKDAPIWGEFGEAIERICEEISDSDSS